MRTLTKLTWLSALCAVAIADGLSEYASPDAKLEFSRVFRPSQDLKMVESRPGGAAVAHAQRKQRPPSQVVYGKPIYQEQRSRPSVARTSHKKFKPSPEDPFFTAGDLPYAPSHKYFQKYAQQLYAAQKNVGHLSEYQKYIINQDPEVKKFVYAQTRAPKQIFLEESTTAPTAAWKAVSSTIRPVTTTEKVKGKAEAKVTSRKEQRKEHVPDNAAQSTAYKFIFKPEYVPVYTHADQYSLNEQVASLGTGHLTPTYASSAQYNLGDLSGYKIPATYATPEAHEDEHHDYPTKEPKYEFKYEVKDHEKNSNFGHSEARKGKTTWGKYFVQLSDGRLETVKYWADKTGYHAEVDFKGQAKHPPTKPKEHTFPHSYAVEGLKLYTHDAVAPHQLYAVSEHTPIAYH